jgi:hypothetical protein
LRSNFETQLEVNCRPVVNDRAQELDDVASQPHEGRGKQHALKSQANSLKIFHHDFSFSHLG